MRYLKRQVIINEKSVENMHIPHSIRYLYEIFKNNGKKLFLVGGAVRDFITGDTPKDFDLATDATPDEMKQILSDFKINLQGEKFGVIVVYNLKGLKDGVEIATFREDIGKGKDTVVKVGSTIEGDVIRRDISFNGLYYDLATDKIVDLVGGVDDLNNKIVKMIGNPIDRINEDKLRILRIFRFAARYDSEIDVETSKAIKNDNKLDDISQERIIDEFMKSFYSIKDFSKYIGYLDEFKMWKILFKGISFDESPDYKSTNSIEVCLSQLFINESNNIFNSVMTRIWKFPIQLTNTVKLLVDIPKVDSDIKAMNIRTNQIRTNIDGEIIEEFINIIGIENKYVNKILKFNPSDIKSVDIMDELGMDREGDKLQYPRKDGHRLGIELNKRRIELFKSL